MSPTLTNKDIARMTGFSTKTVHRRKKELGLDGCRVATNKHTVRYNRNRVKAALKARGYDVEDDFL